MVREVAHEVPLALQEQAKPKRTCSFGQNSDHVIVILTISVIFWASFPSQYITWAFIVYAINTPRTYLLPDYKDYGHWR